MSAKLTFSQILAKWEQEGLKTDETCVLETIDWKRTDALELAADHNWISCLKCHRERCKVLYPSGDAGVLFQGSVQPAWLEDINPSQSHQNDCIEPTTEQTVPVSAVEDLLKSARSRNETQKHSVSTTKVIPEKVSVSVLYEPANKV